jgi:catechol 2,3-dioxygenase-like lactoylglutathione lyase family enzyme
MKATLEVVISPVSDPDRSLRFYREQVGFDLDVDYAPALTEVIDRPAHEDISHRLQRLFRMRSFHNDRRLRSGGDHRAQLAGAGDGAHLLVSDRVPTTGRPNPEEC